MSTEPLEKPKDNSPSSPMSHAHPASHVDHPGDTDFANTPILAMDVNFRLKRKQLDGLQPGEHTEKIDYEFFKALSEHKLQLTILYDVACQMRSGRGHLVGPPKSADYTQDIDDDMPELTEVEEDEICAAPFFPSANFTTPARHDKHGSRAYHLVCNADHEMKIYSNMAGVRYGGGFDYDSDPLPGIQLLSFANSKLLSEACFFYCRSQHHHDEEDYNFFRQRPALVRPEEYVVLPPPEPPRRSTSSPTPTPEPEPFKPKNLHPQETGTLTGTIKAKRPAATAPGSERLHSPLTEPAAQQAKPPSRRQHARGARTHEAAAATIDACTANDLPAAAATETQSRKRKAEDLAWFVLPNG
ncbi:hypothetical protein DFH09DRAFT_1326118 [Mycena vulgaris]|nr:hypothetical protein DFH09DRAFT_1326118 [Mycena vulgaris]